MSEQEIIDLLTKYQEGKCTAEEKQLVESWYHSIPSKNNLTVSEFEKSKDVVWNEIRPTLRKPIPIWRYAAILLVTLSLSALVYTINKDQPNDQDFQTKVILPGSNQAILILGQTDSIDLKAMQSGEEVKTAGAVIKKLSDGTISYEIAQEDNSVPVQNKLVVPRGGKFRIVLADSSVVAVNSESTLEFPSKFDHGERRIKMIGEGYFEITKNLQKPFIVETKGQQVQVLGTKFNIKSYPTDKNVITTLVEGKVKVKSADAEAILKPGDQSIFDGSNIHVMSAKVTANTAWKDDYFVFESEPLGAIMQKISRWYDVDVVFENKDIPNMRFTGSISKHQNIEEVIDLLKMTDKVSFTINKRTIQVKSK